MRLTVFHVKLVHAAIFAALSAGVLHGLASGLADRPTHPSVRPRQSIPKP
jgi:hypothetical protein